MEGLGRLGAHLPLAWIEEALAATGTASIRRRRLPAEQVVWLVIPLALYRRTSMSEVLENLDLALPGGTASAVTRAGICQARQRLGADPLAALFERTAQAWCALDAPSYAGASSAPRAMPAERSPVIHRSVASASRASPRA